MDKTAGKKTDIDLDVVGYAVKNALAIYYADVWGSHHLDDVALFDIEFMSALETWSTYLYNDSHVAKIGYVQEINPKEMVTKQSYEVLACHRVRLELNVGQDKHEITSFIGLQNMIACGRELLVEEKDIVIHIPLIISEVNKTFAEQQSDTATTHDNRFFVAELLPVVGIGLQSKYATPCPVHGKLLHRYMVENDSIYRENERLARQEFDKNMADKKMFTVNEDGLKNMGMTDEQIQREIALNKKMREEHYLDSMADRACGSGYNYCVYTLSMFGNDIIHPKLLSEIEQLSEKLNIAIKEHDVIGFE